MILVQINLYQVCSKCDCKQQLEMLVAVVNTVYKSSFNCYNARSVGNDLIIFKNSMEDIFGLNNKTTKSIKCCRSACEILFSPEDRENWTLCLFMETNCGFL